MKPENQIKLRQSAYTLMNFNFGSLDAMAEDKKPYNKDEAVRNADLVAMLADVPEEFFGEGTDKGHARQARDLEEARRLRREDGQDGRGGEEAAGGREQRPGRAQEAGRRRRRGVQGLPRRLPRQVSR